MKYDFTKLIDRHDKDAIAIDGPAIRIWGGNWEHNGFDIIPMWVADMNFETCPTIPAAMIERAKHPLYGYYLPGEPYYKAIIGWQMMRNGVTELAPENIGYENGVLGGVINALNVLCSKGDNVLVHTPTYVGFTHSLTNNGYHIVHSELKKDENGIYRMDFEDMEKQIKEHKIHCAIFCSPHNPCGRIWEKEEIEQFTALCEKYEVYIISDEIWSDLLLYDNSHIPTQSVSSWAKQHTVALYAPSKTFNLAGLIGSYHICYNSWLKDRLEKESSLCHYNDMNVMSMHALIGAYSPEGMEWVGELRKVLSTNVDYAMEQFGRINEALGFEGVKVSRPEGTYMILADCREWLEKAELNTDQMLGLCYEVGVFVQDGRDFNCDGYFRMNLALPTSRVEEAFERLKKYVFLRQ